jgi:hypothetical protein
VLNVGKKQEKLAMFSNALNGDMRRAKGRVAIAPMVVWALISLATLAETDWFLRVSS